MLTIFQRIKNWSIYSLLWMYVYQCIQYPYRNEKAMKKNEKKKYVFPHRTIQAKRQIGLVTTDLC